MKRFRSTTILAVRHKNATAIGGDGQVTLGQIVMKGDAHKIRRLHGGKVLVGFAGSSADAFALLERFEAKLKDFQGSVPRAATELAKDWRLDRALRRLEAMMIAIDKDSLLMVSGTGDVIQQPMASPPSAPAAGMRWPRRGRSSRIPTWARPTSSRLRSGSPASYASIRTRISKLK